MLSVGRKQKIGLTVNRDKSTETTWCPKLQMWATDALKECNLNQKVGRSVAIFPRWWIEKIASLSHEKTIDFNFIGSFKVDQETEKNRRWILEYARKNFTRNSHLQFTDKTTKSTHLPIAEFDYTHEQQGFVPKEQPISNRNFFDYNYYSILCRSKFTLCPSGDSDWSMRFYESIACQSIPILPAKDSFRTLFEKDLNYYFFERKDSPKFSEEIAKNNYEKFIDQQTFLPIGNI